MILPPPTPPFPPQHRPIWIYSPSLSHEKSNSLLRDDNKIKDKTNRNREVLSIIETQYHLMGNVPFSFFPHFY